MNLQNMTSLAAFGRLQNAIKYCTKVRKRVRPAKCRIMLPLFSIESPNFKRTSMPNSLHPHRIWCHQLLPIGISRVRKTTENATSNGFKSNFSGAAFCNACPTNWWVSCSLVKLTGNCHIQMNKSAAARPTKDTMKITALRTFASLSGKNKF